MEKFRLEKDLSKYEKQIKRVYPFLSDEFVKDLVDELYGMCERCCKLEFKYNSF